jgi:hypothetical protein
MRKLILISALLLASASAQASETRGLTLASAEQPSVEKVEAVKPAALPTDLKPEASKPAAAAPVAAAPVAATPEPAKPAPTSPAVRRESDEAKARRIAARYGISW